MNTLTPEFTNIIDEYLHLTRKYLQQYGEQTVVFLMVGAFYEMYGLKINESDTHFVESNIGDVAFLCDLNVSKKTFKWNDKSVYMAGFRDFTLEKYIQRMTAQNYTCVVYDQEEDNKQSRIMSGIYSPGTFFQYEQQRKLTNNMTCIWVEEFSRRTKTYFIFGIASIDIYTGLTNTFEYTEEYRGGKLLLDEVERYFAIHEPSEVIVIDRNVTNKILHTALNPLIQSRVVRRFSSDCDTSVERCRWADILNCEKQVYVVETFKRFFGLSEELLDEHMVDPISCQSMAYLLHWMTKHNLTLTLRLHPPSIETKSTSVYLANHSLKQLNYVDNGSQLNSTNINGTQYKSVVDIVNKCKTPMGRRKLNYDLTHPVYDINKLEVEYQIIEITINTLMESHTDNSDSIVSRYNCIFSKQIDVDKAARSLIMKKIVPRTISQIYTFFSLGKSIMEELMVHSYFNKYLIDKSFQEINHLCTEGERNIEEIFDVDKIVGAETQQFEDNIFAHSYETEVHQLCRERQHHNECVSILIQTLCNIITQQEKPGSKLKQCVKFHETDKLYGYLSATKRRCDIFKKWMKEQISIDRNATIVIDGQLLPICDFYIESASGGNSAIKHPFINSLLEKIFHSNKQWKETLFRTFMKAIDELTIIIPYIEKVSEFIATIDSIFTKAVISKQYGYCRPCIRNSKSDESYASAQALRHCIIERIQTDHIYTPNTIEIGGDAKEGILLYGTNAVGKTSLMKALGIAVILAQSGMYVPCSDFTFFPFKKIFTRILNTDNIFRGLSTFAVEMTELRNILNNADCHSLVLGDELCSGTEHDSALSIFVSGIQWLYKRNAKFIFATHLHEIVNYDEIKAIESNLAIYHLSVHYDKLSDILVYDRVIKGGSGESVYGLEVCKSLHLPDDFIDDAFEVRSKYTTQILDTLLDKHTSRYNSKVIMGICEICRESPAVDVHHLQFQKNADKSNLINGHLHKNHKSNLVAICKNCHDDIHRCKNTTNEMKRLKSGAGEILCTND